MGSRKGGDLVIEDQALTLNFVNNSLSKSHVAFNLRDMRSVAIRRCHVTVDDSSDDGRVSGFVRIVGVDSLTVEDCTFHGACNRAWLDIRHARDVRIKNVAQDGGGGYGGPIISCKSGDNTGSKSDRQYARDPLLWKFDGVEARNIAGIPPDLAEHNLDLILLHSPNDCLISGFTVSNVAQRAFDSSLDVGWKSNDAQYSAGRVVVRNSQLLTAPRCKVTGRASAIDGQHKVIFLDDYFRDTRLETYYGVDTVVSIDGVEFDWRWETQSPIKLGTEENLQEGPMEINRYQYNGSAPLLQRVNVA